MQPISEESNGEGRISNISTINIIIIIHWNIVDIYHQQFSEKLLNFFYPIMTFECPEPVYHSLFYDWRQHSKLFGHRKALGGSG